MKKIFTLLSIAALTTAFGQIDKSQIPVDRQVRDMAGNLENVTPNLNTQSRVALTNLGFEPSQGYTLGTINGQNGWTVTNGGTVGPVLGQNITNELAFNGTQSFKISQDARFGPQTTLASDGITRLPNPVMGGFYTLGTTPVVNNIEFYAQPFLDGGSVYQFGTVDTVAGYWRDQIRLYMDDETIYIANFEVGQYQLALANVSEDTWYKFNVNYNPAAGTIDYLIDDELVLTRNNVPAASFGYNSVRFIHDNAGITSLMYVDGVVENLAVTDAASKTKISVYPNPTADFVNIQNANGEKVQSITLGDSTGRTLKQIDAKETKVNLQDLPKGVYILKVKTDKGLAIQKVIKK